MRIVHYSFMLMFVVIITLGAESFIQKKVPTKKQPRIKQEDIAAINGELLKKETQLLKEIAYLQETHLNDTCEIIEQQKNNRFDGASQQDLQVYASCAKEIENALQECIKKVRDKHPTLKTCIKKL